MVVELFRIKVSGRRGIVAPQYPWISRAVLGIATQSPHILDQPARGVPTRGRSNIAWLQLHYISIVIVNLHASKKCNDRRGKSIEKKKLFVKSAKERAQQTVIQVEIQFRNRKKDCEICVFRKQVKREIVQIVIELLLWIIAGRREPTRIDLFSWWVILYFNNRVSLELVGG